MPKSPLTLGIMTTAMNTWKNEKKARSEVGFKVDYDTSYDYDKSKTVLQGKIDGKSFHFESADLYPFIYNHLYLHFQKKYKVDVEFPIIKGFYNTYEHKLVEIPQDKFDIIKREGKSSNWLHVRITDDVGIYVEYNIEYDRIYISPKTKLPMLIYSQENITDDLLLEAVKGTIGHHINRDKNEFLMFPAKLFYDNGVLRLTLTFDPDKYAYHVVPYAGGSPSNQTHVTVLSRKRKIVIKDRTQYVRYKNQLIKLSEARKLEKQLAKKK